MYAITGITGQVGGALAGALLEAGRPVRAVLRDAAKCALWAARGCETALADMTDAGALARAFAGAEGVFILPPPEFDPAPGFPEARRVIDALVAALASARPRRVLCLSTIGADARQENLLSQRTLLEEALGTIGPTVTFLRPAWFIENAGWDVPAAREEGVLRSFLQPAEKAFPMVATRDIGELGAVLIQEEAEETRIVELEGPTRISPKDLAASFARVLGRPVRVEIVPRTRWEALFRAQGMKNPGPRIRMLDGFNEGWIEFADAGSHARKGATPLDAVIAALVSSAKTKIGDPV